MPPLTGHCLCRAITFELSGAPERVVHCHCESCRRSTSAPIATFVIVRRVDVRWIGDAPVVYPSSPGVRRSFCGRCGSPLAYETERRPDLIDLYACSLSDPAAVTPGSHVHVEEQLPWLDVLDDLPRYARGPQDAAPIAHGPRAKV